MTRYFCDACGSEISGDEMRRHIDILCHIAERTPSKPNAFGYSTSINGVLHPFSGRHVRFDMCIPCYNQVASAAMDKIDQLKESSK